MLPNVPSAPRFSIVIPTYGRAESLAQCLHGCAALEYPRDQYEVIVVDDGDAESTRLAVADYVHLLALAYIPQPQRMGPARARNAGVAAAKGEYVVFIDDDCIPEKRWLRELDAVLSSSDDVVCAGGSIQNDSSGNVYAAASQNLVDFLYEWYNADPRDARFFASNNMACPRRLFVALGGFDDSFPRAAAEDRDFCDRWREQGWRLVSAPRAVVRHKHRLTFRSFLKQHHGYGKGAVYLHEGRERRGVQRPKLESMTFYWRLITHARRTSTIGPTFSLVMLAIASQFAYATGYYFERLRRRQRAVESNDAHSTSFDRSLQFGSRDATLRRR